jgi:hypothetical protein
MFGRRPTAENNEDLSVLYKRILFRTHPVVLVPIRDPSVVEETFIPMS